MQKDVLINNPVIFNAVYLSIYPSGYSFIIIVAIVMLTSVNYYA